MGSAVAAEALNAEATHIQRSREKNNIALHPRLGPSDVLVIAAQYCNRRWGAAAPLFVGTNRCVPLVRVRSRARASRRRGPDRASPTEQRGGARMAPDAARATTQVAPLLRAATSGAARCCARLADGALPEAGAPARAAQRRANWSRCCSRRDRGRAVSLRSARSRRIEAAPAAQPGALRALLTGMARRRAGRTDGAAAGALGRAFAPAAIRAVALLYAPRERAVARSAALGDARRPLRGERRRAARGPARADSPDSPTVGWAA